MSQYAAKETMQRRNQTAVGEEERKVLEVSSFCVPKMIRDLKICCLQAYQLENEANQTLEAQLDGKPIVYGQIIQVRNLKAILQLANV
jgi:hypothetical protein